MHPAVGALRSTCVLCVQVAMLVISGRLPPGASSSLVIELAETDHETLKGTYFLQVRAATARTTASLLCFRS